MTRCQECGYDWDIPASKAVATIGAFPARLSVLLRAARADDDPRIRIRPAATTWSPLEYIAHTGDAIDWYARRVDRVLSEHRPALDARDWDAYTSKQRYHERRLDELIRAVSDTCTACTAPLAVLDAAQWNEVGIGSDGQPRTVLQLARRAAHEAHHHLQDVQIGLASRNAASDHLSS